MSRRFSLFALLAAVCLLFASCGALFIKAPVSNKGSIVIPLRASDRKASSPLELCTHFVFTIENADFKDTAEGTATIEFGEVPFGTYTLTGTAYGKLSEETNAQEEVIATCKVENLVINSPEPKAVDAAFTLSEATLIYFNGYTVENEDADGNPVTIVFTGTDKTTKISETKTTETQGVTTTTVIEYAIDANGNNTLKTDGTLFHAKETVTEPQSSGNRVTVTEYDYNAGNPQVSKTTVTEPDGKKTVSEFNLNTSTQGCSKRVTVEEGNTTTVSKYDTDEDSSLKEIEVTQKTSAVTTITTYNGSNWEGDLFAKQVVIDSGNGTTTTTENLSTNKAKIAKVTVEVTSGSDKGKTTVTEYDTAAAATVRETVTVTNPDNSSVVTTFNDSDKETKKVETDTNNVSTVTLFSYGSNTKSETLYETGYPAVDGTSIADKSKAVRTVENTYNGEGEVVSTAITDFEYVDITAYDANDTTQTQVPPYKKTTTCTTVNGITSTTITTYDYSTESSSLGKQTNKTTTVDGVVTAYERYVYGEDGLFITESYKTTNGTGYTTKEVVYRNDTVHVIVKDRDNTSTTLFDKKGGSVRCSSTVTTTYNTLGEELSTNTVDNGVSADAVLEFLSQNYYVGGSSLANLNFVNDSTATESQYAYFYQVDFADFYANHNNCFKYDAISNGTLTCYLHNDKSGCSNFWDATIADSNENSQKFSSHIKGNNLGTADN